MSLTDDDIQRQKIFLSGFNFLLKSLSIVFVVFFNIIYFFKILLEIFLLEIFKN